MSNNKVVEIIKSASGGILLHGDGFLYYKHSGQFPDKIYWRCRNVQEKCKGRINTLGDENHLVVTKENPHGHGPNHEEVESLRVVNRMKRKAEEHPDMPPAQIIRTELRSVPSGLLYCTL